MKISMLTASNQYAGFEQSPASAAELLTTYVDPNPTAGAPVTLDSGIVRHWEPCTDAGGDTVGCHAAEAIRPAARTRSPS